LQISEPLARLGFGTPLAAFPQDQDVCHFERLQGRHYRSRPTQGLAHRVCIVIGLILEVPRPTSPNNPG
jgi:hypothetical protein